MMFNKKETVYTLGKEGCLQVFEVGSTTYLPYFPDQVKQKLFNTEVDIQQLSILLGSRSNLDVMSMVREYEQKFGVMLVGKITLG